MVTVWFIDTFLSDPEVIDYLAEQLGTADALCVKPYAQREPTQREHAGEIQCEYGFGDFRQAGQELTEWIDARAWTTDDGPKAIFDGAVGWLRRSAPAASFQRAAPSGDRSGRARQKGLAGEGRTPSCTRR